MNATGDQGAARALVGGFGRPGMRDLDFGRQVVSYLEALEWPQDVVVEDLSYSAPLVLHRLQELNPSKVVLLGAAARGDQPGSLRRYRLDLTPPSPDEVRRCLEDSVGGVVDIDHTLAVARHWGGFPADTVVIEVEPADCSFGPGFSEELAESFDQVVEMVRAELGAPEATDRSEGLLTHLLAPTPDRALSRDEDEDVPSDGMTDLVAYAKQHEQVRSWQQHRGFPLAATPTDSTALSVAARSLPWGIGLDAGGAWFDVVELGHGAVGVVIGDVGGRGVEAAAAMADLRAAARAYAVVDGSSPSTVLAHLDRLVRATGLGGARVLYLCLDTGRGHLRFANAGQCPPLVVGDGATRFLWDAESAPLGADARKDRAEAAADLPRGSTLLLFNSGLVESRATPMEVGLDGLRRAAAAGPVPLEDLCDHVLDTCLSRLRRDDDICLLALRLPAPRSRYRRRFRQAATGRRSPR